jgi:hypothetical protein
LRQKSQPVLSIRAQVPNTTKRFEDTTPIGFISFFDAEHDGGETIVGSVGSGGDGVIVGTKSVGGSGIVVGGLYKAQVERITYEPSNTPGRVNAMLQFGATVLETSAKIKRLERDLANAQQYS